MIRVMRARSPRVVGDLRRGVVAVLLGCAVACGGAGPTSPTVAGQPVAVASATAPPPKVFPPPTGPSRTFVFDRAHRFPVSEHTRQSLFVLYDNGAVEYASRVSPVSFYGGYRESGGLVAFEWNGGWQPDLGGWEATGRLTGEWLTVEFNEFMQLTSFEDAVYVIRR